MLGLLSDNIFLRTYLPGQCIFSDGDAGEFIYILMRGRVEVQSQGGCEGGEEGNGQFSWQKKRISWECNDSLSLILAALPGEHLQMSDFHGVSDCSLLG